MPATPAVPHAGSTAKKLETLLAYHLEAVKNLQGSIALLTETAVATKAVNGSSVMLKALELDAARRSPVRGDEEEETDDAQPKSRLGGKTTSRRQVTAAVLDSLSQSVPRPLAAPGRLINLLERNGYIRQQGAGWVRTAKRFYVSAYEAKLQRNSVPQVPERLGKSGPKIRPGGPTAKRFAISKALESFSRKVPKPFPLGAVTATTLARHGYLRKIGRGWVRTAKPYMVSAYQQRHPSPGRKTSRPRRAPSTTGRGRQSSARDYNYKAKKLARRQHTADVLAQFNTETPTPHATDSQAMIGTLAALKRRGYLKGTPDGYLRTGKEFVVTQGHDPTPSP